MREPDDESEQPTAADDNDREPPPFEPDRHLIGWEEKSQQAGQTEVS